MPTFLFTLSSLPPPPQPPSCGAHSPPGSFLYSCHLSVSLLPRSGNWDLLIYYYFFKFAFKDFAGCLPRDTNGMGSASLLRVLFCPASLVGGGRDWGQVVGKNCLHVFQSSFSQLLLSTAPPLPPSGLLKREALRLGEGTERKELLGALLHASEISTIIIAQFIVEKTESPEG